MKRYYYISIIILTTILTGCSEFSYQLKPAMAPGFAASPHIPLDETYVLYVRAVTSETRTVAPNKTEKVLSIHQGGAAKGGRNTQGKIIEIEYLFVSPTLGRVIYISTVADRYENRYSSSSFLGLDNPNAADFRVFLIGRISPHDPDHFTFYFKDGKHTDNWTITRHSQAISLRRIEQMHFASFEDVFEIHDALAHPVTFTKMDRWAICYLPKDDTNPAHQQPLTDLNIYYDQPGRSSYHLWLNFPGTRLDWKDKYIAYKPD